MGADLATFPALPDTTQIVTLGGAKYQVRLVWMYRTQSWYMDLLTQDGTPLALGRRLSPGWGPVLGLLIEDGPTGQLVVRGPSAYRREDLGTSLLLRYFTREELQAAAAVRDAATAASGVHIVLEP